MNKSILLLGSNLGNKKENINKAFYLINKEIGETKQISDFLETAPEGYKSDNYYLNVGITIYTDLSPIQLLKKIKIIEHKLGRTFDSSDSGKYEDRTIDIDIVYYNDITFLSEILNIPHLHHVVKREFSKIILHQLV